MSKSQAKYDPFSSRSMEHTLIAQALFTQHLPPHLQQPTDLETMVRVDRANTDKKLAQRRRDIVYKAQMQAEIALLLGAEHQSQPDITMTIRLLYYSADNLAPYLEEYQKLPLLIQFLFYNGEQAPYPYPTTLQDYYGHAE